MNGTTCGGNGEIEQPNGEWHACLGCPACPMSDNQRVFVIDAEHQGMEVDFGYSGRFMYGKICPAVRVDDPSDFLTMARTRQDQMGKGVVIYAER